MMNVHNKDQTFITFTSFLLFIITSISYSSAWPTLLGIIPFFSKKYSNELIMLVSFILGFFGFTSAFAISLVIFLCKYVLIPFFVWGAIDVVSTILLVETGRFAEANSSVAVILNKNPALFIVAKISAIIFAYISVIISPIKFRKWIIMLFSALLYFPVAWNLHFISFL